MVDFSLSPEIRDLQLRIRAFVAERILPLEADPASFDAYENIAPDLLEKLRGEAKSQDLWALQMPKERGGQGLNMAGLAVTYEEMGHSIFGPVVFNAAAPDDGNMLLLNRIGTEAQKDRWLQPIIDGELRSAFAMTEPNPGVGSDPGAMRTVATKKGKNWIVKGEKWFTTGAGVAKHFVLVVRTSDDERRGLSTFLFHGDQPGWEITRRIPIMGPEEHGGHCELRFDGLEIPDEARLLGVGDGLKVTQNPFGHGTAHPLHALARHGEAGAGDRHHYVRSRESFGMRLSEHEGVQWMLGEAAKEIAVGPAAHPARGLETGSGGFRPQGGGDGEDPGRRYAAQGGGHGASALRGEGLLEGHAP